MLQFPDLLTTTDLRARYSLPFMRSLVELVIGVAFFASCLSLLLRERKVLGLAGLGLTLAVLVAGGAGVEVRGDFDGRIISGSTGSC